MAKNSADYEVSRDSKLSLEDKIEAVKNYSAEDLMAVMQEMESDMSRYDPLIIQGIIGRLYDMGIKCVRCMY